MILSYSDRNMDVLMFVRFLIPLWHLADSFGKLRGFTFFVKASMKEKFDALDCHIFIDIEVMPSW